MSDRRFDLRREYAEELKQCYLQSGFKQGFEAGYAKAKEDFERPHGEWMPKQMLIGGNGAVFMHNGFECKCGRVVTQKENFCPDCGEDKRKEGEANEQTTD